MPQYNVAPQRFSRPVAPRISRRAEFFACVKRSKQPTAFVERKSGQQPAGRQRKRLIGSDPASPTCLFVYRMVSFSGAPTNPTDVCGVTDSSRSTPSSTRAPMISPSNTTIPRSNRSGAGSPLSTYLRRHGLDGAKRAHALDDRGAGQLPKTAAQGRDKRLRRGHPLDGGDGGSAL